MKKALIISLSLFLGLNTSFGQNKESIVQTSFIERVLNGLASDEMRGRHAFTEDAEKAADFIAKEFKEIGLVPYVRNDYKQSFVMTKVSRTSSTVLLNNKAIETNDFLILGTEKDLNWN